MADQHEFDANDDEAVNVFYDLTVWDADQRSALVESLAAASVPHAWRENELVVPESAEDITDEIFDRLEHEIGLSATMTKPLNFNLTNGRYLSAGCSLSSSS